MGIDPEGDEYKEFETSFWFKTDYKVIFDNNNRNDRKYYKDNGNDWILVNEEEVSQKARKVINSYLDKYFEADNYKIVAAFSCYQVDMNKDAWMDQLYYITYNGVKIDYKSLSSITKQAILDKNKIKSSQLTNKVNCDILRKVENLSFTNY